MPKSRVDLLYHPREQEPYGAHISFAARQHPEVNFDRQAAGALCMEGGEGGLLVLGVNTDGVSGLPREFEVGAGGDIAQIVVGNFEATFYDLQLARGKPATPEAVKTLCIDAVAQILEEERESIKRQWGFRMNHLTAKPTENFIGGATTWCVSLIDRDNLQVHCVWQGNTLPCSIVRPTAFFRDVYREGSSPQIQREFREGNFYDITPSSGIELKLDTMAMVPIGLSQEYSDTVQSITYDFSGSYAVADLLIATDGIFVWEPRIETNLRGYYSGSRPFRERVKGLEQCAREAATSYEYSDDSSITIFDMNAVRRILLNL